ncbi:Hypothetical protein, putative [Bodo saltans]|uniref:Uncharacterized protein n=1 Tax=Bodo saltans TaxID=75058 RepID=A0A0S4J6Q5_BODSA|nr:Hypothetical protein, putative [Bodo saltans]|eukprot:CUG85419.1 Hypothetical protein, putative [Bodo saltans]
MASTYIVNWRRELTKFYKAVLPNLDVDIDDVLSEFRGYEEALWFSLCGRYGVDPETLTTSPDDSETEKFQFLFRVMKIYARYSPAKLLDVDSVLSLGQQSGFQSVLHRLEVKYGREPRTEEMTTKERVVFWFAYYGEGERIEGAEKLLTVFEGHEEALWQRLTNDLGQEPRIELACDPREPRLRLARILQYYDPNSSGKLEYLYVKNVGNFLRCFALLQRRYGREPLPEDVKLMVAHRHALRDQQHLDESINLVKLMQVAETEAKRREQMAAKASDIVEFASTAHLVTLRNDIPTRDKSIIMVRRMVAENDNYNQRQLRSTTEEVLRAYSRLLLPSLDQLVSNRFGPVKEALDWLCYLDFLFTNALPLSSDPTLRQVASLLEIRFGDRVGEITAAGGVEAFVNGVDRSTHNDWIRYLVNVHGMPNEHTIGVRNRNITHFLYYNPSRTVADAEAYMLKAQRVYPLVEEALTATFGEEPPAPPVNLDRVARVLERYAPHRLPFVEDVIEAHCLYRDRPDDVLRRVCRTYGPELTKVFAMLELLFGEECERRFQIFVAETRVREILARRFAAAVDSASDIYNIIEERAAKEASLKMEMQLNRIRKQQEDIEAQGATAQSRVNLLHQETFKEEELARFRVIEEESEAFEDLQGSYAALFDVWDETLNLELAELLKRQKHYDDFQLGLTPIREIMIVEAKQLHAFLGQREIWRQKWLEDERQRDQMIETLVEERRSSKAIAAQQMEDALLVSAAFSDAREHELLIKERFAALNEQAMHVLRYNAELQRKRAEIRANGSRVLAHVETHRGLHANCRFTDANYNVSVTPRIFTPQKVISDEDLERDIPDRKEILTSQVAEYLEYLFSNYEPTRTGTERDLLKQYEGREAQLVLGLEQKYNIHRWMESRTKERLDAYLSKMAPHLRDESTTILRRFAGQEESMWKYLSQVYGPVPQLQAKEMRLYLKNRLVRYLRTNAPHLLLDADMMVDRCDDNGDKMFERLTSEYGPEPRDVARDTLERKLRSFYKRRHMHRSLESTAILARRFVGREHLLSNLIAEKFGESFDGEMPDADEMLL